MATRISQLVWLPVRRVCSQHQDLIADSAYDLAMARPYSEVPGPTPMPLIGNTWRLLPIIGRYIGNVALSNTTTIHLLPHPLQFTVHAPSYPSGLHGQRAHWTSTMKPYGGMEADLHAFLTLALKARPAVNFPPFSLYPRERAKLPVA